MKKKEIKDIINFASVGLFMLAAPFFGFTLSAAVTLFVIVVNNVYYAFNNDEKFHCAPEYIQEPIDFEKELNKTTQSAAFNGDIIEDTNPCQTGSMAYYMTHDGHYI